MIVVVVDYCRADDDDAMMVPTVPIVAAPIPNSDVVVPTVRFPTFVVVVPVRRFRRRRPRVWRSPAGPPTRSRGFPLVWWPL
jgi:hypothetical protein